MPREIGVRREAAVHRSEYGMTHCQAALSEPVDAQDAAATLVQAGVGRRAVDGYCEGFSTSSPADVNVLGRDCGERVVPRRREFESGFTPAAYRPKPFSGLHFTVLRGFWSPAWGAG